MHCQKQAWPNKTLTPNDNQIVIHPSTDKNLHTDNIQLEFEPLDYGNLGCELFKWGI